MKEKFNLFKILQSIAILGLFVAVTLGVLMITQVMSANVGLIEFLIMLAIVCAACLLCLPWARKIEKGEYKKVSIVFVALICAIAIMCVVAVALLFGLNGESTDAYLSGTLNFAKICVVLLIQLSTATLIATTIIKYNTSMLVFQIVSYVAHLYVDFYITFALCCVNLTKDMKFQVAPAIDFLGKKFIYVALILMLAYVAVSRFILSSIDKRKQKEILNDGVASETHRAKKQKHTETVITADITIEQKLEKLKKMYEDKLITEEEYNAKKSELINYL